MYNTFGYNQNEYNTDLLSQNLNPNQVVRIGYIKISNDIEFRIRYRSESLWRLRVENKRIDNRTYVQS